MKCLYFQILSLCLLCNWAGAARIECEVRAVARDAIYLGKGFNAGLRAGQTGSWLDETGQVQELRVLFAALEKASAIAHEGARLPAVGSIVVFITEDEAQNMDRITVTQDADSLQAHPVVAESSPPAPTWESRSVFWWNTRITRQQESYRTTSARLGLRGNLSPELSYSLAGRYRNRFNTTEGHLEQAMLRRQDSRQRWSLGRHNHSGQALPGTLDGIRWELGLDHTALSAHAGMLRNGSNTADPAMGAGIELGQEQGPWSGNLQAMYANEDPSGRLGLRFGHRLKLHRSLRLRQWLRRESPSASANPTHLQSGSRLQLVLGRWSASLDHRSLHWEDAAGQLDSLWEDPANRQALTMRVSRSGRILRSGIQLEGRDEQLSTDMESLLALTLNLRLSEFYLGLQGSRALGPKRLGHTIDMDADWSLLHNRAQLRAFTSLWSHRRASVETNGHSWGLSLLGRLGPNLGLRLQFNQEWEAGHSDREVRLALSGSRTFRTGFLARRQ